MNEEEQCVYSIAVALHGAFEYFHKGVSRPGDATEPLSVAQATELMEVLSTLLDAVNTDRAKADLVTKMFEGPLFGVLAAMVTQPLIFGPDASSGFSLQQTFVSLRISALRVIEKITLAASLTPPSAAACLNSFAQNQLVPGLLHLLSSPATFEALRVAAIESIFVFLLRTAGAKRHVVQQDGVAQLLNCLLLEPAATVRNYICSALREIAAEHGAEVADANLVNACLKLIGIDDSADVRTLCLETLLLCLRANTRMGGVLENPNEMVAIVKDRLERDPSPAVVEAAAKLVEVLCLAAKATSQDQFYESFVAVHAYRSLILALKNQGKAAAAAARALRFSIQLCPPQLQLGYRLVTQFQVLSALLKATMDLAQGPIAAATQPISDVTDHVLRVELAIAISMLFIQSPVHRQHVYKELHAFPMWSTTLKSALIGFLNSAALDYFSGIDLIDVTGVNLANINNVEWGEAGKPKKSSIRALFAAQEQRAREQRFERPAPLAPTTLEHETRRKLKLTFILLNYGVHLTLSAEDPAVSLPPPADLRAADGGIGESPYADPMTGATTPGLGGVMGRGASTTTPRRAAPMFPNPSASLTPRGGAAMIGRPNLTPREREEMAIAYDRFDSAFKLTLQFAQLYSKRDVVPAEYEPTPDGFVVRKAQLRNPWGPLVQKEKLKSWTVRDLKPGDLFYFAIPFDDLKLMAVETVIEKCHRHLTMTKKNFITTPQIAKGRRWFLYDMIHSILPKVLEVLYALRDLVQTHGGDNVRFPLFLFREKEMHLGERALHCGNVVEVVDQVKFYFSQNPTELLGVNAAYVQHVEERMRKLAAEKYTGDEHLSEGDSENDVLHGFAGHGDLSSESDEDDAIEPPGRSLTGLSRR